MYSTAFYPLWLVSGEGKIETTPAPVLSIIKVINILFVLHTLEVDWAVGLVGVRERHRSGPALGETSKLPTVG